jgi:hypothetical protein
MEKQNETISLTFGDQGENHVGMTKIGNIVDPGEGFNYDDLVKCKKIYEKNGYKCKIHDLNKLYKDDPHYRKNIKNTDQYIEKAHVLVIKNGMGLLLHNKKKTIEDLNDEMNSFEWDRKYFDTRRKRVLNKHARANVCFGKKSSEPNYKNKKGRIVAYSDVPTLNIIRKNMKKILGPKFGNLICEGNRYFDLEKCGIGWHGDAERRKVVAFRLGKKMRLNFHWFHESIPFGKTKSINLSEGDMYIMSEKAVGNDWRKKKICTLRHSAGIKGSKYTEI